MNGFGMLVEDPFYDEDGVLIDEDADWADIEQEVAEMPQDELSPFQTVNS